MKVSARVSKPMRQTKKETRSFRILKADSSQHSGLIFDRVMFLQRTIGNQGVERLIRSGVLQAKLRIGQPRDKYEQEADRVADQVTQMQETQRVSGNDFHVRANTDSGFNPEADLGIENQIQSMKGGGNPLSERERAFFEPRFGIDLGHVRVHTGSYAIQMNRGIGARAFTHGSDIYFGAGHSPSNLHLTAHELTHVVQQGSDRETSRPPLPVGERTSGPLVQGAWIFKGEVTNSNPIIGMSQRGHASVLALPISHGVFGKASAWQVASWTIEGGNAHLVMRRDTRYTFEHTGTDNNLLTLRGEANIFGGAEADDLHYAQAEAVVVGNKAVRTVANPAPVQTSLFPPIKDGGRSEAKKSSIGEVDVSLPVGDGTVDVHIPLTKTDEGELAPLGESHPVNWDEPGGGIWKSVDVYLVAYMEATADIESAVMWDLAGDVNWAKANADYKLRWEERPIPAPTPPPGTVVPEPETQPGMAGVTYACAICKCSGDKECGGGRIHTIWMGKTECNRENKKKAQKLCNHDTTFLSICDLDQNRKDGKKCSVHHHDFACSDSETEKKCLKRRQ